MNQGEKIGIRNLARFMHEGKCIKQTLTIKDTGSNKYTIYVENLLDNTLHYSVLKVHKSGNVIGTVHIDKVSEYGMTYNNTVSSLPDSVVRYIRDHYVTFTRYLSIGENAFK